MMTKGWRDIHGYFVVAVKIDGRLVATRRVDTKKEADAYAKARRARKEKGVKVTISRVEGTHTDFERGKHGST